MRRLILIGAIAAAVLGSPAPAAFAVEKAKTEDDAATAPAPVEAASNAPFMKPLGRFSTILGSLSFLRELCGDGNAGIWRSRMDDLLKAQGPNKADREILIASYNSGYRAFASVYRRCTPSAREAVTRYQREGSLLGRDIASRFGN